MHFLKLAAIATLGYSVLYIALGWVSQRTVHHYYELAQRPERDTAVSRAMPWLLRAVLVYGLLGWLAELMTAARSALSTHSLGLLLAAHLLLFCFAALAQMVLAWIAYKLHAEFRPMYPEGLIAVIMIGFVVFGMSLRLTAPWNWLAGM